MSTRPLQGTGVVNNGSLLKGFSMRTHRPIVHLIIIAMMLTVIPLLQPAEAEQTILRCPAGINLPAKSRMRLWNLHRHRFAGQHHNRRQDQLLRLPDHRGCLFDRRTTIREASTGGLLRHLRAENGPDRHRADLLHVPGGSGSDVPYGIAVDGNDNIYITGITYSADFPVTSHVHLDKRVG